MGKSKIGKLVVFEGSLGFRSYHLRVLRHGEKPNYNGCKATTLLCGKELLGWDVIIPESAWGTEDDFSSWCKKCSSIREQFLNKEKIDRDLMVNGGHENEG